METTYILLYGGDTVEEGTVCGPDTKRRCDTAIKIASKHPTQSFIIFLAAGIRPDKKYPGLKYVMEAYLKRKIGQKKIKNVTIVICPKNGWTTFYESVAALETLKDYPIKTLFVLSSWYHLFRIKIIWWLLKTDFSIRTISAPSPKVSSIVREIGGIYRLIKKYRDHKKSFKS